MMNNEDRDGEGELAGRLSKVSLVDSMEISIDQSIETVTADTTIDNGIDQGEGEGEGDGQRGDREGLRSPVMMEPSSPAEPAKLPPAPSFKSVLVHFLKQLATTSTDLHRITAPAIMLNGVSLLEYMTHWCDHPSILASISAAGTRKGTMIVIIINDRHYHH